ncbi:hypothetical protein IFR05_014913 [Cadophora sp. M221]|nr:hypothetical protein IFR05_014913 [Cadophora sp. M221]
MTRLQALLSTLPPITLPPRSEPLTEFTLFPKLPRELRNKIWEHTTQVSRKVKVFELDTASTENGWDSRVDGQMWIPGIMHACRESRYEGKRVYKLCYEKPQSSRGELERASTGQLETRVASSSSSSSPSSREGLMENSGSSSEPGSALTASNGPCLYINFNRDVFIISPHNQVSDTFEAAIAPSPLGAQRPSDRNTIFNGGDDYTLHSDDLRNMQRIEHTFRHGTMTDIGFLVVAPVREFTLNFRHHSLKDGDNVGGDLLRCIIHSEFEQKLRNLLGVHVKVPGFVFYNRWLRGYGQDLDPACGVVVNTPCPADNGARICLEDID